MPGPSWRGEAMDGVILRISHSRSWNADGIGAGDGSPTHAPSGVRQTSVEGMLGDVQEISSPLELDTSRSAYDPLRSGVTTDTRRASSCGASSASLPWVGAWKASLSGMGMWTTHPRDPHTVSTTTYPLSRWTARGCRDTV